MFVSTKKLAGPCLCSPGPSWSRNHSKNDFAHMQLFKGRLLPPGFDAHLGDLSWGHFGIKMHKPVMIHDLHHVSDVFDLCHGVYAMLSPYRPHPQVPLGMPGTGSCAIYLIQKKALLCTGPFGIARCTIEGWRNTMPPPGGMHAHGV